jgi:DNA mismatch repair protein MutL
MADIINLLPDSVANQIAAGEVIQRPASAVKELLENAVDSGADEISLIIRDAGKTLIQVIDNGCGMSETDARMCFERHATSKIKEAGDLFAIRTLGFRGEAMASIAAIAQVELKTRRIEDETGTLVIIEASKVKDHKACVVSTGTSVSVKNLFYNIPARRKFLKSNNAELRHIIVEFHRTALVQHGIRFSFFNEGRQLYALKPSNRKQRIISLFGSNFNNRLIPVELSSPIVEISGFLGKPEFARKTRGEQYFFVNDRFVKHHYLNHAVDAAFRELIPKDSYPAYFIYFRIDPQEIDINIHPSKTEINFQNNQVIYAMLSSAIKQALGRFNIVPSIDFEPGTVQNLAAFKKDSAVKMPEIRLKSGYNPFIQDEGNVPGRFHKGPFSSSPTHWGQLHAQKGTESDAGSLVPETDQSFQTEKTPGEYSSDMVFPLGKNLVAARIKSGLLIIHTQRASERIYFEEFIKSLENQSGISQQSLFPVTFQFSPTDAGILRELKPELKQLGFDLNEFGENTFILNGTPADLNNTHIKDVLDGIIENFKNEVKGGKIDKKVNLAKSMAINLANRQKDSLEREEILALIDKLFATGAPEVSPDGKPVVRMILLNEIENMF